MNPAPLHAPPSATPSRVAAPPSQSTLERISLARRAAVGALALGVLADMLLRDGPIGIGLALWMLVFAGTTTALVWRRGELTREQAWWLTAAVFFASGVAWRDAGDLQFFDFAATLAILLVLGTTLRMPGGISAFEARLRDLIRGAVRLMGDEFVGLATLLLRDVAFEHSFPASRRTRTARLGRAVIITIPLLILFGTLFRSADPLYDKLLALPSLDLETIISHVLIAGFFTWIVGGWFRGSLVRDDTPSPADDASPIVLSSVEVTIMLGALNALFASFVAVQIGWLFGGAALVKATTGLSVAEYARRGFFELVWVSLLVLPVLLGASAALPKGDAAAAKRFRQLSLPLIGLLGAVMVSALGRMSLYVEYYGLSTDRVDSTAFMLWLAIVFVLFALTVLRGRPKRFAGGMFVSGLAVLAGLNVVSPDAITARYNVEHSTARGLDLQYLARQSGDATPVVVSAVLAGPTSAKGTMAYVAEMKERCNAARELLTRWSTSADVDKSGAPRRRSWTTWNRGQSNARRIVRENESALRGIACPLAPSSVESSEANSMM